MVKNLFEVLRQKEAELQQLQKEIEVLRAAAKLLAETPDLEARPASNGTAVVRTAAPVPPRPAEAALSAATTAASAAGIRQFP